VCLESRKCPSGVDAGLLEGCFKHVDRRQEQRGRRCMVQMMVGCLVRVVSFLYSRCVCNFVIRCMLCLFLTVLVTAVVMRVVSGLRLNHNGLSLFIAT